MPGNFFSGGSCTGADLQEDDEMEAGEYTEFRDDEHNLARLLHSALKEADACAGYALEAEAAGNEQLVDFFRDVQSTYASVAGRAEEILDGGGEDRTPTGVRPGAVPAEGDPGDVSPGQDVATPATKVPPRPTP
jgi:hypothetical protein